MHDKCPLRNMMSGSSVQQAVVKGVVNFFVSIAIKAALIMKLGLLIFDEPFLWGSLALGVIAVVMGLSIAV